MKLGKPARVAYVIISTVVSVIVASRVDWQWWQVTLFVLAASCLALFLQTLITEGPRGLRR